MHLFLIAVYLFCVSITKKNLCVFPPDTFVSLFGLHCIYAFIVLYFYSEVISRIKCACPLPSFDLVPSCIWFALYLNYIFMYFYWEEIVWILGMFYGYFCNVFTLHCICISIIVYFNANGQILCVSPPPSPLPLRLANCLQRKPTSQRF